MCVGVDERSKKGASEVEARLRKIIIKASRKYLSEHVLRDPKKSATLSIFSWSILYLTFLFSLLSRSSFFILCLLINYLLLSPFDRITHYYPHDTSQDRDRRHGQSDKHQPERDINALDCHNPRTSSPSNVCGITLSSLFLTIATKHCTST